jgi:hypothetical protein
LFASFVRQSGGGKADQEPKADTWVAISRPPYFTALALWFAGGTYHTGAYFPDRQSFWVGHRDDTRPDLGTLPSWLYLTPPQGIPYIDRTAEWTDRTVHFNRLLRDGWQLLEDETYRSRWQKQHPSQQRTLIMAQQFESFEEYGGPYQVEFELRDDVSGDLQTLGQATWGDWDQRGRLVLAQEGRLVAIDTSGNFTEIADLNSLTPDPQPSPDWARQWPDRP